MYEFPTVFTYEERLDIHGRYQDLDRLEERTKKDGSYFLFASQIQKNRQELLMENPFPRFEPLPTLVLANQIKTELPSLCKQEGFRFVIQKGDLLYASCRIKQGKVVETISCGGYIFNNVMMAADYTSGLFDETTVSLYLASMARTNAIFDGSKQLPKHHGYFDFYYNLALEDIHQVTAIDFSYADEMLDYLPDDLVARTITAYSPLGVFSREYGTRIVSELLNS